MNRRNFLRRAAGGLAAAAVAPVTAKLPERSVGPESRVEAIEPDNFVEGQGGLVMDADRIEIYDSLGRTRIRMGCW